jgi:hypothetical protein
VELLFLGFSYHELTRAERAMILGIHTFLKMKRDGSIKAHVVTGGDK